nr:MAG TPA_asm: hypothetical protein [Caudoviricetes sp.]
MIICSMKPKVYSLRLRHFDYRFAFMRRTVAVYFMVKLLP